MATAFPGDFGNGFPSFAQPQVAYAPAVDAASVAPNATPHALKPPEISGAVALGAAAAGIGVIAALLLWHEHTNARQHQLLLDYTTETADNLGNWIAEVDDARAGYEQDHAAEHARLAAEQERYRQLVAASEVSLSDRIAALEAARASRTYGPVSSTLASPFLPVATAMPALPAATRLPTLPFAAAPAMASLRPEVLATLPVEAIASLRPDVAAQLAQEAALSRVLASRAVVEHPVVDLGLDDLPAPPPTPIPRTLRSAGVPSSPPPSVHSRATRPYTNGVAYGLAATRAPSSSAPSTVKSPRNYPTNAPTRGATRTAASTRRYGRFSTMEHT